jgi:DNA ligase D-like protein (predicted ligase)
MQAKLVTDLPGGADWLYEIKFDGYRALILKDGERVRLLSRRQHDLSDQYARVRAAAARIGADRVILDGEIVALDGDGRPSFQGLQNRASRGITLAYFAFDVLHLDGVDLLTRPLDERKATVESLIDRRSGLHVSRAFPADAAFVDAARGMGLEGVVAKRRQSRYEPGQRSGAWRKFKLERSQEFVVGGYRPASGGVDALVLGYYVGEEFRFAAKVRAGLTPHARRELQRTLVPLHAASCPFADLPTLLPGRWGGGITSDEMRDFSWVRPELVVQARFVEWTDDGHLRHAAFVAVRDDKRARDVTREG